MPNTKRGERIGAFTPTIFRDVLCPLCGTSHGHRREMYGAQMIGRRNYWDFQRKDKPFGYIRSSAGKGTLETIGPFGPEDDPDGYFPLVKGHLLAVLREWQAKGWITSEEILRALG